MRNEERAAMRASAAEEMVNVLDLPETDEKALPLKVFLPVVKRFGKSLVFVTL